MQAPCCNCCRLLAAAGRSSTNQSSCWPCCTVVAVDRRWLCSYSSHCPLYACKHRLAEFCRPNCTDSLPSLPSLHDTTPPIRPPNRYKISRSRVSPRVRRRARVQHAPAAARDDTITARDAPIRPMQHARCRAEGQAESTEGWSRAPQPELIQPTLLRLERHSQGLAALDLGPRRLKGLVWRQLAIDASSDGR